jgi:purine-cytosine permease-like protein
MVADYTESVVPASARRSNFRMLLTFGSMQLVFGAVLVGYSARFEGLSLGSLMIAMAIAATTMTVHCIGSANVGAVVGLSTWGNEPDIFRYAKAGRASWWNVPAIVIPHFVGAFLFPIMGYLIAVLSNQPHFSASIKYFANFTLFGLAGLMLVVLLVNQWAVQDRNLYIAINGAQRSARPRG